MAKTSSEQRFRDLFNKKRSSIIVGVFVFFLLAFGLGKSFSFVAWIIACSPFVVIFWSTFGERIKRLFNWKGK